MMSNARRRDLSLGIDFEDEAKEDNGVMRLRHGKAPELERVMTEEKVTGPLSRLKIDNQAT